MDLQKLRIYLMTMGYTETSSAENYQIWRDNRGYKFEVTVNITRKDVIWYINYNGKNFHFVEDFFKHITKETPNDFSTN